MVLIENIVSICEIKLEQGENRAPFKTNYTVVRW
jgi:hypothetical protein